MIDHNETVLTKTVAMPADTNPNGDIFGGWLLSQMDVAGGILAKKIAKGRVATVAIEGMKFLLPVKVGDTVKVIAGDDKGSSGKVLKVIRSKNRVIVEGVAMVKKHNKPNSNNPKGGITEKESSIHISNVSLTTKDGEITRVGYRIDDDKKVRYSKKDNEII